MTRRETAWDPAWFGESEPPPQGDRRTEIMRDVLERLSDEDQFLAYARIYEKLSFRELGDRVGLSHEGARQRWRDIQKWIKKEYEKATERVTLEHPEYFIRVEVSTTDVELYDGYIADGWRIVWN